MERPEANQLEPFQWNQLPQQQVHSSLSKHKKVLSQYLSNKMLSDNRIKRNHLRKMEQAREQAFQNQALTRKLSEINGRSNKFALQDGLYQKIITINMISRKFKKRSHDLHLQQQNDLLVNRITKIRCPNISSQPQSPDQSSSLSKSRKRTQKSTILPPIIHHPPYIF